MKIGTRFKVEFITVSDNACRALGYRNSKMLLSPDKAVGDEHALCGAILYDVIEPPEPRESRVRWTDPSGKVYEKLRPEDTIEKGDIFWQASQQYFGPVLTTVGSIVREVIDDMIFLRPVKEYCNEIL
jgi:hypothetical protein